MPLAVVGSNVVVEVNGRKVRGRQYPWGVAEGTFHPIMAYMNAVIRTVPLLQNGGCSSANEWSTSVSAVIQVHVSKYDLHSFSIRVPREGRLERRDKCTLGISAVQL